MVDPIQIPSQALSRERLASEIKHELELTEGLPALQDRLRYVEELLERHEETFAQRPDDQVLSQLHQQAADLAFQLRNLGASLTRLEERLGQGASEPIDLTLQQTLDVVQQLREVSGTIPNDERVTQVSTSVCEGLESFVTSVLTERPAGEDQAWRTPSLADLKLALEVMEQVRTCPGADRRPIYRSLSQQFIDAACHAAWQRVDRACETRLDRATRKEYLHEALTIWTLAPELAENAGSPRLSQLPSEIRRAIQQVLLREVIGGVTPGGPERLLDWVLKTREFTEEYLSMVPAVPSEESRAWVGLHLGETLLRRLRAEISSVRTWQALETSLGVLTAMRTADGLVNESEMRSLARPIAVARWRIRALGVVRGIRTALRPMALLLAGLVAGTGAYLGVAWLIQLLYAYSLPLAP